MQIHQIKREHPLAKSRQVGRGGKRGKTAGRGTKGQKARAGHKMRPELRDIIKKLPMRRGHSVHGTLRTIGARPVVVSLAALEKHFSAKDTITPTALVEKGLVSQIKGRTPKIKILGGALTKSLTIKDCLVSATAKSALEQVGGSVA